jgi:serine/threonine protein kinase
MVSVSQNHIFVVKTPGSEPIPGYRLLERLGRGGFGEVWKCEAPGGLLKAIKFVHGQTNLGAAPGAAEEELRAVERIKSIRHPFLLSMERVERLGTELVVVMELADRSLHDLWRERCDSGLPGLPKDELLSYLREVAEVLDLMNFQHGLQHLDIKPRNLLLVSTHVKLGDFGLVNSLLPPQQGASPALQLDAITPAYAAPEIFSGTISRHCDQYSLAIAYHELLTGTLPFNGRNPRQLLFQHVMGEPNLASLCEDDRTAVAKALAKDPADRFASCTEFIQALGSRPPSNPSLLLPQLDQQTSGAGTSAADTAVMDLKGTLETRIDQPVFIAAKTAAARPESQSGGNCDPLARYQFLGCVGSSPLAETWRVRDRDGSERLVKYVYGMSGSRSAGEADAVQRLNSMDHSGIAAVRVVRHDPGRVVLVTPVPAQTLWYRYQGCRQQQLPGVPEGELLGYLHEVAETLDQLLLKYGIQHRCLNPRNVWIENGHARVADFGLAEVLWLPAGQPIEPLAGRYAAPEVADAKSRRGGDQYSLALIYAELLTGVSVRSPRSGRPPAVDLLPEAAQRIVQRALDADPSRRWGSCLEMVQALERQYHTNDRRASARLNGTGGKPQRTGAADVESGDESDSCLNGVPLAPELNRSQEFLLRRFSVPMTHTQARARLEQFRQQVNAKLVRQDAERVVLTIARPQNLWQQCLGRQPGLEIDIRLTPVEPLATPITAIVQITGFGPSRKQGSALLQELGQLLLDSIRASLQTGADQRCEPRQVCHQLLRIRTRLPGGDLGEPVECRAKDISVHGIGFYVPQALKSTEIVVEMATGTAKANIVRVHRRGDGWYEVGALFINAPAANTSRAPRLEGASEAIAKDLILGSAAR